MKSNKLNEPKDQYKLFHIKENDHRTYCGYDLEYADVECVELPEEATCHRCLAMTSDGTPKPVESYDPTPPTNKAQQSEAVEGLHCQGCANPHIHKGINLDQIIANQVAASKDEILDDLLEWEQLWSQIHKEPFNWYGAVKALKVAKDHKKPFSTLKAGEPKP